MLNAPRGNAEILANLSQNAKDQDRKLQRTQTKLTPLNATLAAKLTKLRGQLKGPQTRDSETAHQKGSAPLSSRCGHFA